MAYDQNLAGEEELSGLSVGLSVVIPTYNGEDLLRQNLPSIVEALGLWGGDSEIIVVDDCSSDKSVQFLNKNYPQIRLIINAQNMGFAGTCNAGMAAAKYSLALCLNNDVKVEAGLIEPLFCHFEDPDTFAVTPNILAEREGRNQGIVFGMYGKGFLKGGFANIKENSGARENLYAVGACVVYDLAKFSALGGFSHIFTPYLFEDVDISYRAWKRGWKSIYEPKTTAYHYSSATIGKVKKRLKRTIYFRNRFLFHWINLTDPRFIAQNAMHTLLRLAISFLWFDIPYYAAFFGALRQIKLAKSYRKSVIDNLSMSDGEILHRTERHPS
ncbi:glycosyltransferase family 2 protein [Geotalea sp. SG265]|uniref:glycosyltransferase family 2 protein n=1 Tax=Geotalea sp. SG265 TaxID=2922867 RepID=UPI001FAF9961|nr:glycosyltransferase family 2 protein [Geotalea sp. SG265]